MEWQILALGLALGIRHAFDPDHLVAVTTIVSEYRHPLRAIWIGVSWGLGHTTTLFLAGAILLALNVHIPETLSPYFESLVGVMLIVLGLQTLWSFRRNRVHIHIHSHEGAAQPHKHFHSHAGETAHQHPQPHIRRWPWSAGSPPSENPLNGTRAALQPFFRLKSYIVGTVHGLAGSASLMLLVLADMHSTWSGVSYILVFGLGTLVSMGFISIFISLPFSISGRLPRLNRIAQAAAGAGSIAVGLLLMFR
jgi:ABC-type nickel/cobalt efflux system permease component RcnA